MYFFRYLTYLEGKMDKEPESLFQTACEFTINNEVDKAIPLFEKADKLGHQDAAAWLASIYIQGNGVDVNYQKGLPYLEKSVNQGNPYCINLLGTLYSEGKGLPQDYEQAFISFSIAAEKGEPYALLNLADCYINGNGTEVDIEEAIYCYFKILTGEYEDGIKKLALEDLAKYEYIPIIREFLVNYDAKAEYSEVSPRLLYELAQKCISLEDFEKSDIKKYKELLEESAQGGYAEAQYELGKMLETGIEGFEKDIEKSKEWIEKAADQGHYGAIYTLQYMTNPHFFDNIKTVVNKTKYKYKGKVLFRKYLALEIIKDFVSQHPEATLKSLNEIFTVKNKWGFDVEFIYPYDEVIIKRQEYNYYFNEPITLGNGEIIAILICSDFFIVNSFKNIAVQLGFDIGEVHPKQESQSKKNKEIITETPKDEYKENNITKHRYKLEKESSDTFLYSNHKEQLEGFKNAKQIYDYILKLNIQDDSFNKNVIPKLHETVLIERFYGNRKECILKQIEELTILHKQKLEITHNIYGENLSSENIDNIRKENDKSQTVKQVTKQKKEKNNNSDTFRYSDHKKILERFKNAKQIYDYIRELNIQDDNFRTTVIPKLETTVLIERYYGNRKERILKELEELYNTN